MQKAVSLSLFDHCNDCSRLEPSAKVDNVEVLFFPHCVLVYGCGDVHFNDYNYFEGQW
jgi:hypothetical protein